MKKSRLVILILATVLLATTGFGGISSTVKDGNRLFEESRYDQALAKYTDAQLDDPDNPGLHYNIGSVLYKQKKYDKAIESFRKVAETGEDNNLISKAWYNMGNSFFMQATGAGDAELLSKAVDAYTEALKLNPEDEDAKYNLEVARSLMKMKKEEQPPQSCPNKQPKKEEPENQNNQQQQNQTGENQTATSEQSISTSESDAATPETQPEPRPQPAEGEMTPEEAERLLNALEDRERENAREEREAQPGGRRPYAGKDW